MINLVSDFGADPTGSAFSDAAIAAAIASIPSKSAIYIQGGTYSFQSPVILPQNKFIRFVGDGGRTTLLLFKTAGIPFFRYERVAGQYASRFHFDGLDFILQGIPKTAGSSAIYSYGASDAESNNRISGSNCMFAGWDSAIKAKWTGQARWRDTDFEANNRSFDLSRGSSFWYFDDIMSFDDTLLYAKDPTFDAFSNSLFLSKCHNVGGAKESICVEGFQVLWAKQCGFDLGTGGRAAVDLVKCSDINIESGYISSNNSQTRYGVRLESCVRADVEKNTIVNNRYGIATYGDAGVATRLGLNGNRFDGNAKSDVFLAFNTTASHVRQNHFSKIQPRTGTDFELYANVAGVDRNFIDGNIFRGGSYPIIAGPNSLVGSQIWNAPPG